MVGAGSFRRDKRANDDHRGDGVGDGHQRRMQRRRHRPHHIVADEDRQHEDTEAEDQWVDRVSATAALREGWSGQRKSTASDELRCVSIRLFLTRLGLGLLH